MGKFWQQAFTVAKSDLNTCRLSGSPAMAHGFRSRPSSLVSLGPIVDGALAPWWRFRAMDWPWPLVMNLQKLEVWKQVRYMCSQQVHNQLPQFSAMWVCTCQSEFRCWQHVVNMLMLFVVLPERRWLKLWWLWTMCMLNQTGQTFLPWWYLIWFRSLSNEH